MGRVIGRIGLAVGLGLAELTLRWTDEGVCPYVGEERHTAGEQLRGLERSYAPLDTRGRLSLRASRRGTQRVREMLVFKS